MLVIRQSQQCYSIVIFLFSKLFFLFLSNFGRIELRSYLNFSCLLFAFQIKHACWYCSCKLFWFFKLLIIFYQAPLCKCILLWLCCAFNQAALCLLMSGSNASSLCVWTEELHQGPTIWLPPTYMQTKQQNLENIILRILENTRIFWQHQGPTIWLPTTFMQTKQQNVENIKYLPPSGEAKWKWFCYQGEKIGRIWDLRVVGIPIASELKQYTCCHSWSSLTKWGRG